MDINSLSLQISNFATTGAQHAWVLSANFIVLVVLTLVMIGFSYKSGKGGIISLLLSFYIGYAVFLVFPYTTTAIGWGGTTLAKAIISMVIYFAACIPPFIFIQRIIGGGYGVLSFVPRFALSFLAATFLLAIAYHVFNVNHLYTFPKPLDQLFAPNSYFFWWFAAPFIGMYFLVH
jgi:hypothetical protein